MTQTIRIQDTVYALIKVDHLPDCDLVVAQRLEDQRPEGEEQTFLAFRFSPGTVQRVQ